MAAKPPHVLLIDCPPPSNDDDGGWRQQRRVWTKAAACKKACSVAAFVLLCAAVVTFFVLLCVFSTHQLPSCDPVYMVAITGVTGLDVLSPPPSPSPSSSAANDNHHYTPATTLSPVFNLTFQIDTTRNNSEHDDACISGLSTAQVSYGDAILAGGSVPPFCAGGQNRTTARVAAVAWGDGVAVPKFLRDRLAAELAAGDASVDVEVTMPTYCMKAWCGDAVLSCKPKIGGGPSPPCRLDFL